MDSVDSAALLNAQPRGLADYEKTFSSKTNNTQPYYRLVIPLEGENYIDIDVGSADYEHHGNRDDFQKWLELGLTAYEKQ